MCVFWAHTKHELSLPENQGTHNLTFSNKQCHSPYPIVVQGIRRTKAAGATSCANSSLAGSPKFSLGSFL